MSNRFAIKQGLLQSDLDCAGFNLLNFSGGGGGGTGLPPGTVSVKAAPYNAVGDGVTDDTSAIQAAINATGAAGGGTVFFPRGKYLCNGAFDATTNSILKFPYVPIFAGGGIYSNPVTIQLLGETPVGIDATATSDSPAFATIKSTKAGTGTAPAILAAYAPIGRTLTPDYTVSFSYVQAVLRNLQFETGIDPTIHGVRLDSAVMAIVEDVVITTQDGGLPTPTQPTHGTVGLWMPVIQNFATVYCNRVWAVGFDTGLVTGEHFRSPQFNFLNCNVGAEFLSGIHLVWGNFLIDHCKVGVKFTNSGGIANKCPIVLNLGIEQVASGWQTVTNDIVDTGNVAYGEIRYWIQNLGTGGSVPISVSGGSNLRVIQLNDAVNIYIGTKARLVPIVGPPGGVQLQVLNNSAVWENVDSWTAST